MRYFWCAVRPLLVQAVGSNKLIEFISNNLIPIKSKANRKNLFLALFLLFSK